MDKATPAEVIALAGHCTATRMRLDARACTSSDVQPRGNVIHCGMKRALRILDIPHEGTHHRALSDAISRLLPV